MTDQPTMTSAQMVELLSGYLKENSDRFTELLGRRHWKPTRAHIEDARNAFTSAENTLQQFLRSFPPTPPAGAGRMREAMEAIESSALKEAAPPSLHNGSHRRFTMTADVQAPFVEFGVSWAKVHFRRQVTDQDRANLIAIYSDSVPARPAGEEN